MPARACDYWFHSRLKSRSRSSVCTSFPIKQRLVRSSSCSLLTLQNGTENPAVAIKEKVRRLYVLNSPYGRYLRRLGDVKLHKCIESVTLILRSLDVGGNTLAHDHVSSLLDSSYVSRLNTQHYESGVDSLQSMATAGCGFETFRNIFLICLCCKSKDSKYYRLR